MGDDRVWGIWDSLYIANFAYLSKLQVVFDLAMHGLPAADNNSIAESKSKDYPLHSLKYYIMCNSCSSEVVGQLDEHNNKGTI